MKWRRRGVRSRSVYGDGAGLGSFPILNPAFAPGLVAWYKRGGPFFQDTAGATPATAVFDGVRRWNDSGGSALHATQATASSKCRLSTHAWPTGSGLQCLGTANWLRMPDTLTTTQNSISLYVRFQMQDTEQVGFIVNLGDGNAHELGIWNNGGLSVNTESETQTGLSFSVAGDNIVSLISGSAAGHVTMNGRSVNISGQGANALVGGSIGNRTVPAPNKFPNELVSEIVVCNQAHSASVEAGLLGYFNTWGYTQRFSTALPLVVCDGNSVVKSLSATSPDLGFVNKTIGALTGGVQYANFGITGQCVKQYSGILTGQMTENAAAKIDVLRDAARTKNVLVAMELVNSASRTASGAALKSEYQTYLQARKTAGWTVIAFDYNEEVPVAFGTDCNTLLAADFPTATSDTFVKDPGGGITYADKLIKWSAMAIAGWVGGVHPPDAGHASISTSLTAALSQLGVT